MKNKLKHLFLPFLLLGGGFILIYSFILWLLSIKLDLFELPRLVTGFFIPLLILWILASRFLEPRLDLIRFKSKFVRDFYFYAALLFVVPTGLMLNYLDTSIRELTHLTDVSSIEHTAKTKFYKIDNYTISYKDVALYSQSEVSKGKQSSWQHDSIFIVAPLYDSVNEKDPSSSVWLGVKYSDSISHYSTDQEKQKSFETLVSRSRAEFATLRKPDYFDRIGPADDLSSFTRAIQKSPKFNPATAIVLVPKNGSLEAKSENFLIGTLLSFAGVLGIWFFMLLFARLDYKKIFSFSQRHAKR